ncbi:MAG: hypothetical protein LBG67_03655 [Campylobacteraceae bacterium]|jgi:hypothetical protein|nr:hypothetical protein [Campylobacteraceae bacterium]
MNYNIFITLTISLFIISGCVSKQEMFEIATTAEEVDTTSRQVLNVREEGNFFTVYSNTTLEELDTKLILSKSPNADKAEVGDTPINIISKSKIDAEVLNTTKKHLLPIMSEHKSATTPFYSIENEPISPLHDIKQGSSSPIQDIKYETTSPLYDTKHKQATSPYDKYEPVEQVEQTYDVEEEPIIAQPREVEYEDVDLRREAKRYKNVALEEEIVGVEAEEQPQSKVLNKRTLSQKNKNIPPPKSTKIGINR